MHGEEAGSDITQRSGNSWRQRTNDVIKISSRLRLQVCVRCGAVPLFGRSESPIQSGWCCVGTPPHAAKAPTNIAPGW